MRLRLLLVMFSVGGVLPIAPVESSEFSPFWYAGVSVAHNVDDETNDDYSRNGLNAVVDGVHLGYQLNPYVMTEVEFQYLGSLVTNRRFDNVQQGVVNFKLGYPLTDEFMPYVKVGGSGWVADNYFGYSGLFGAGLSYQAMDNIAFNLEYQYTDSIGNNAIGHVNHQRIALGLSWRFGYATPRIVTVEVDKIVNVKGKTVIIGNVNDALFLNNSSTLNNASSLLSVVELLTVNPDVNIVISGHADSVGRYSDNQQLSEQRAKSVATYLIHQGIAAYRISSIGYGELVPIADNATAIGRALNRRVVIDFE